jgi:hypothetical protein
MGRFDNFQYGETNCLFPIEVRRKVMGARLSTDFGYRLQKNKKLFSRELPIGFCRQAAGIRYKLELIPEVYEISK